MGSVNLSAMITFSGVFFFLDSFARNLSFIEISFGENFETLDTNGLQKIKPIILFGVR